ncbi:PilN domain-containing protein [Flavobacteriaceae bacterium]|nr:PilN domain-containing protein [Flavobacteriaceae bacterium]
MEHSGHHQDDVLNATLLVHSKKELNIHASFKETSIEAVSTKLPKHQHITLSINNGKILSKTLKSDHTEGIKLVYSAFPNINLDDFYFEIHSQKNIHFINVCRKDYINALVDTYAKHKLSVLNISLGNHAVINLIDFINEDTIFSSNAKIVVEDTAVIEIEKAEVPLQNYEVNGSTVTNQQLLSFSAALQPILNNNSTKTNFSTKKNQLVDAYKHRRFFHQFMKFGGLFILGVLLVNFFVFNHYFESVNALKQLSEINLSTKNKITSLNETVSIKQKMVDDLLKSNGSKSSFYCDAIIQSLPKTVLLTDYSYQPLLRRIKEDRAIEVSEKTIFISGSSVQSADFSEWINRLEKMDWIEKVAIMEYRNTNSKKSEFKISIRIKK